MSPPPPSLLRLRAAVAQLARLPPVDTAAAGRRPEERPDKQPDKPPAPERSRVKSPPLLLIISAVLTALLLVALVWYLQQLHVAQALSRDAAHHSRPAGR
jgi:uncharacterized protein HemX